MTDLRGYCLTLTGTTTMVTETCYSCGVLFAMTKDFRDRRLSNRSDFYCPNGHSQAYVGKTDAQRLKEAEAREVALRDQYAAEVREGEKLRQSVLRDRQRIAKGVCVCCDRYFANVHAHMSTQHPDYDAPKVKREYQCSCGSTHSTFQGLRTHQGQMRPDGWESRSPDRTFGGAHLTVV